MILLVWDMVIRLLLLVVVTTLFLGFSQRLASIKVYLLTISSRLIRPRNSRFTIDIKNQLNIRKGLGINKPAN
jgi:hypothetical protein